MRDQTVSVLATALVILALGVGLGGLVYEVIAADWLAGFKVATIATLVGCASMLARTVVRYG